MRSLWVPLDSIAGVGWKFCSLHLAASWLYPIHGVKLLALGYVWAQSRTPENLWVEQTTSRQVSQTFQMTSLQRKVSCADFSDREPIPDMSFQGGTSCAAEQNVRQVGRKGRPTKIIIDPLCNYGTDNADLNLIHHFSNSRNISAVQAIERNRSELGTFSNYVRVFEVII